MSPTTRALPFFCLFLTAFAIGTLIAHGQTSKVLLSDDFTSNTIDPTKYKPDAPFFEGGTGDIHATAHDGVIEFVGTTSQQWWSGATLAVVPTYDASEQSPVTISIDRVAEAGQGTASRSALWIMDESKTKYVLFADVRAEGGWRFNRKIGEDGDVPTGSGTDIVPFNGDTFDDGGLHRMSIVANGKTAKLMLDGKDGVEVKFPFSKVTFQFGSYARANDDTASTKWDNLRIESVVQTTVVFSDDFAANTIDPAKFQPDAPFFEGGVGDIHATAHDGVIEFVGTTSQQWWSGGTLRAVPTFSASESTPVTASIDRVAEAGQGTASRSALWVLDETKTKYVLFADVRAEGGWRFNRKIGEDGDVPTGSGTDIAAFNGETFDNGGLHRMSIVADGKTVKLMLDGQLGAEVKFPFSKVIFEFGAYARANDDTASTTWDNFKVETVAGTGPRPVFTDDFAANTIDPNRYQPDAPFFEGGTGDIHATAHDGVIEFVGTTSQQWWSGGTLRVVPTFAPSDQQTITLSIDRVAEAGEGTASRSALWILDESKTKYVLFADVRAEGGWRYNRKIGEDGDVPTGSGTDIEAFNGETFDNGGLHRMSMTADGKSVKLFLDGIPGPEVKFPFSPVVFEFGSYARANNDTASTKWDNLLIESTGKSSFTSDTVSVRVGQTSPTVTVEIPQGFNAQSAVSVRVVSSDPAIAVPEGGTGGALTLTFPAGGPNSATFRVRGVALGGTQFSLQGDLDGGNRLNVAVISGPGVLLEDAFASTTVDTTKWQINNQGFETGTGTFTVEQTGGAVQISGTTDTDFWPGASLKTAKSYVATRDLNLAFEVDRVSLEQVGTAGRSGIFITTADRSQFVFFAQNVGENNWEVNVNPGSPTGSGNAVTAFTDVTDTGKHKMRLVADGRTVEVFLDGRSGGRFPFEVATGIYFEIGGYARSAGDTATAVYDNAKIENVLPCIQASPQILTMTGADSGREVTVTVPQLLNDTAPLSVTITSRSPNVAVPTGAVNGALTLNFAAGAPNTQTISITPVGQGAAVFDLASSPQACVSGSISVEVVACPKLLVTDDFSGATLDSAKWTVDPTPLDTGTATADSSVTITNGQVKIDVTAESSLWPGFAVYTAQSYTASQTKPLTFEVDRAKLEFVLVTGTGAEERSGVFVKDASGNSLFFNDYVAHDGRNYGWRYNKVTGQADDDAAGAGINIGAFDGGSFDDAARHHIKVVVNGATAKLYLDDVLGTEVPFPISQGLTFGFATYVDEATNVARGYFDNARLTGDEEPCATPTRLTAAIQGGNVIISWTGPGTLQESDAVPGGWRNVTPTATSPFSIAVSQAQKKFYRIAQ